MNIEIELWCPVCRAGKMRAYGHTDRNLVYRKCNSCSFTAKYKRIPSFRVGAIEYTNATIQES